MDSFVHKLPENVPLDVGGMVISSRTGAAFVYLTNNFGQRSLNRWQWPGTQLILLLSSRETQYWPLVVALLDFELSNV